MPGFKELVIHPMRLYAVLDGKEILVDAYPTRAGAERQRDEERAERPAKGPFSIVVFGREGML